MAGPVLMSCGILSRAEPVEIFWTISNVVHFSVSVSVCVVAAVFSPNFISLCFCGGRVGWSCGEKVVAVRFKSKDKHGSLHVRGWRW